MFALPGSLLWLFLLVYFACGQILDTSLDNSSTSNRELDDFVEAANYTNISNNEEEEKNRTTDLKKEEVNPSAHPPDINQLSLLTNTSNTNSQEPSEVPQESNNTTSEPLGRNSRRRITSRTGNGSRTTQPPMMSQERRNSYLSIAERRKYYNRTRVQTKKLQLNDVELEHQESVNKLVSSSTETVLVNEIRVVKNPTSKDPIREVTTEKDRTSNQRAFLNFSSNETQGKLPTTRQSVIQSQYQFGQKLNFRKPVSRAQDTLEDRAKRKKEKGKNEIIIENSTNKFSKNYPTQSTKLIRIDKNLWDTTTPPLADGDDENFVTHSYGNATILDKLVDYITSINNNTQAEVIPSTEATTSDSLNIDGVSNNQSNVPLINSFNPMPLSTVNITTEKTLERNFSFDKENISSAIQDVYSQEILKLNNLAPKTSTGKQTVLPESAFSNFSDALNNSETNSTPEPSLNSYNKPTQTLVNSTTDKSNFEESSTTPQINIKISEVTQPTILKTSPKWTSHDAQSTTPPTVKAISKDSTSRTRFTQTEVNASYKPVPPPRNISTSAGGENWSKTEEYPLTIELNENNKRVLSEMFQTVTTPKTQKIAKGEPTASQTSFTNVTRNDSTIHNSTEFQLKSKTISQQRTTTAATAPTAKSTTTTTTESPQVMPPDDHDEEGEEGDHKAQGTRYNTRFYISPKFNETQIIKVVDDDDENDEELEIQGRSAGVAIYVLAAFGLVPLLLALIFGAKFMMQRNQREYECESDAKSDVSANESQVKDNGKKKKGSTDLKKSPSNVTTITLVTATRLPRVQHWENSEKQGNRNWEFPRCNLKLKTILGQGNFGQVWKAEAEDMPGHEGVTRLVAVKTVKEGATEKEHTEFIKELEIMQQIGSHPNIVTLLGCCTDQEPYYLIMEYVKYGKLLTYLREHRVNENYYNFSNNSDALTSRDLTVFAYCVARGMEYLASRGIIHRDLAARNVLVDHNKLCKIADFGMSRSVRDFENGQVYEERQQKGALPIRWMAPESLVYSVFTYKSDVWSFGIVMWEIVTLGSTPYPNMGAREVMRKVRDGYRLERPSHCKPEFYRLISYCWAHDPNKRPDFSELRHELSNLLDNPTKDGSYVDLDRFAVDNSFHVSSKTNDFRLLERNDFKTLQKLGDWGNKDWPEDVKKIRTKRGRNNGKGTVTLTGQGSFTVNSRILEKEFKII